VRSARRRQTGGSVVCVLTAYVLGSPPSKLASYVTAKYAFLGLMRSMAGEMIRHGVRVNGVSPGMTSTGIIADLAEMYVEGVAKELAMGRIEQPAEVASVIGLLWSEDASYMNGANVPVSGGDRC